MDRTEDHHVKQNKLGGKTNTASFVLYVESRSEKET
jgi:hypothetical protein